MNESNLVASSPERGAGGTEIIDRIVAGLSDVTLAKWACSGPKACTHPRSEHEAPVAGLLRAALSFTAATERLFAPAPTGDAPAPSDDVGLNRLAQRVAAANRKWWFAPDGSPLKRNKGELLMLVVTEIAEAFEGERKNLMDDKLPHRRMAEVEVADAIIRLLDYAQAHGYDLDGTYREKMAYNATREDHKREAAQIAAGNGL